LDVFSPFKRPAEVELQSERKAKRLKESEDVVGKSVEDPKKSESLKIDGIVQSETSTSESTRMFLPS